MRHKSGVENNMANALSRRLHLLHVFSTNVTGFDNLKIEYANNKDFSNMWSDLSIHQRTSSNYYMLHDGFFFYKSRLCVSCGFFREFLITELHGGGGLVRHFVWLLLLIGSIGLGYRETCIQWLIGVGFAN